MSTLIPDARNMAARYRPLRAFGLASVMLTQLADRVEELERELELTRAKLPKEPEGDIEVLLDALAELGNET